MSKEETKPRLSAGEVIDKFEKDLRENIMEMGYNDRSSRIKALLFYADQEKAIALAEQDEKISERLRKALDIKDKECQRKIEDHELKIERQTRHIKALQADLAAKTKELEELKAKADKLADCAEDVLNYHGEEHHIALKEAFKAYTTTGKTEGDNNNNGCRSKVLTGLSAK